MVDMLTTFSTAKFTKECFVFDRKFFVVFDNDNMSSVVRVMAWRRAGDKPLPESMLTQSIDASMYHRSSMS